MTLALPSGFRETDKMSNAPAHPPALKDSAAYQESGSPIQMLLFLQRDLLEFRCLKGVSYPGSFQRHTSDKNMDIISGDYVGERILIIKELEYLAWSRDGVEQDTTCLL